jgi:serine/threonine protein phosphatase PrpC
MYVSPVPSAQVKSSSSATVITSYAGVSKKGYAPYNTRKKNQDSLIMEEHAETGSLLLCVFDGHGEAGDAVSQFFRDRMPKDLFASPEFLQGNLAEAISASVQKLESQLLSDSSIDTEFSGTTAVIAVVRGDKVTPPPPHTHTPPPFHLPPSSPSLTPSPHLTFPFCCCGNARCNGLQIRISFVLRKRHCTQVLVGNIGDSRLSIGFVGEDPSKIIGESITKDHKPDRPDEKARIVATGGRVFAIEYDDGIDGPPRVWLGHMDVPGLAMSRSLGDTVAHAAGVSSEPEFYEHTFQEVDKYLVLATDGLWEFMEDQEVMDYCKANDDPRKSVDELIMEAKVSELIGVASGFCCL